MFSSWRAFSRRFRTWPPPDETDPGKIRERQREKEVIRKRLAALADASAETRRKSNPPAAASTV